MTSRSRVALALGSGGARGYAHIGVIAELRERGYDVVGVSGSSMGALVGGLHATGKLDEFTEWATGLTQGAVLRLLDPSLSAAGILRAEKILDTVREILGEVTIEELPIPYTAVATDLIAGKSVWLQRGPLDAAIRASIAIPGVIAPYVLDGRLLADGGILDPVPMAPIAATNADLTIAVSINGSGAGAEEPEDDAGSDWLNRVMRSTTAFLDTNAVRSLLDRPTARAVLDRFGISLSESEESDDDEAGPATELGPAPDETVAADETEATEEEDPTPKLGSFAVMNRTIDIAQAALARHLIAAYPPDLMIEVPRSACRSLDFHRAAEMIDVGRQLTAHALEIYERDRPAVTTIDI